MTERRIVCPCCGHRMVRTLRQDRYRISRFWDICDHCGEQSFDAAITRTQYRQAEVRLRARRIREGQVGAA